MKKIFLILFFGLIGQFAIAQNTTAFLLNRNDSLIRNRPLLPARVADENALIINSSVNIIAPRLGLTSTSGYIWKANDNLGHGSWSASSNSSSYLDNLPGIKVTKLSNALFPYGRAGGMMVQVGPWIYHFGGINTYRGLVRDSILTNQAWRANISDLTTWTQLPQQPWYPGFHLGYGVNGNNIYLWGVDYISGFSDHGPTTPPCWEGVVNISTGAIVWTKTNNAIPYDVTSPSPKVEFAGFVDDEGCLNTWGGMSDDEFKGLFDSNQNPTANGSIWKSCDGGRNWTKVSSGWSFSHRGFKISDILRARTVSGTVAPFNNQTVMAGGGDFSNGTHYSWDNVIFRSKDHGVTLDSVHSALVEGMYGSVPVSTQKWLFYIGGTINNNTQAGVETNLIQYIDTTFAAHSISVPEFTARTLPAACKIIENGIEKGFLVYGGEHSSTDTLKRFMNDLLFVEFTGPDQKIAQGDNINARTVIVKDSIQALYYNPKNVGDPGYLNKGFSVTVHPMVSNPFTYRYGFGTDPSLQEYQFDAAVVQMVVGADLGTSGGGLNNYETKKRTVNTDKFYQLQMPTYVGNGAKPNLYSLIGAYSHLTSNYMWLGWDDALGVASQSVTDFRIGVASVASMFRITSSTTTIKNDFEITVGKRIYIDEGSGGFAGQTTLVSGTKAITIAGVTASSRAFTQLVTPTGASLTVDAQAVCTSNTVTITALLANKTINTADGSTLNYVIYN